MKKILGLLTLFLCVTLFIWANFVVTADDTMLVEEVTTDEMPIIQGENALDQETIQEDQTVIDTEAD